MSNKLTDTQLLLLSAASQRKDLCLTPPTGPRLGPARKAAAKLLDASLVKEVRARKDAPTWRRDQDTEQAFALKLTSAGLKAIAEANVDSGEAAPTVDDNETWKSEPQTAESRRPESFLAAKTGAVHSLPVAPRVGTKISDVIGTLETAGGATIDQIVAATGWLRHTARAALTGLRKRGYAITADCSDRARGAVYRIARTEAVGEAINAGPTALAPGGGDSDHVTDTNPAAPIDRKAGARTRRAA